MSRLEIHISNLKRKIRWIGCKKKFSKQVYQHSRWKFTEFQSRFNLLGINCSVNLKDMIDINDKPVMEKVDKFLSRQNTTNLTPIGKIRVTCSKTLVILKINHLILTLPHPTLELIWSSEFFWNEKKNTRQS